MKRFLILFVLMLFPVVLHAQEPTPAAKSVVFQPPFEIASVTDKLLYRADSVESIAANGSHYLAFEEEPKPVAAVLLEINGNAVSYIEVMKVGSTDFPTVLDEFEPGRYLFEHKGPGKYHVRSLNHDGRPVYAEFTIKQGTDPPDDPDDPPPVGDYAELIKIIRDNKPNDPPVANALAEAYQFALRTMEPASITTAQAKEIAESARMSALLKLPPVTVNWNQFFLAVGAYTRPIADKSVYMGALAVLVKELPATAPEKKSVSKSTYVPRWTYPGDIATHMKQTHGVDISGMTQSELLRMHDNLHDLECPNCISGPVYRNNWRVFPLLGR